MPTKFEASALFEFLGRVDRELAAPSLIFLIGGSAVSIIDPAHSTSDVDLLSPGSVEFDAAVTRLAARGEPVLPIQVVGIAEGPEGLEERLATDRLLLVLVWLHKKVSLFITLSGSSS